MKNTFSKKNLQKQKVKQDSDEDAPGTGDGAIEMEGIERQDEEGDNEVAIASERTDAVRKRKVNADIEFDVA